MSNELRHFTESEVSEITRLTIAWLRKARSNGYGPPFRKLGECVRYPEKDLTQWLTNHQLKTCTRPATSQTTHAA